MIGTALLIVATVLLAVSTGRRRTNVSPFASPLHWLVLPDEPAPMAALALPPVSRARSSVPAPATIHPSWSSPDESWRAEKPFRPWFRGPAPFAVAAAMSALSLDATALGMGVPEIFPTHLTADRHETAPGHIGHGHAGDPWSADTVDLSALFIAPHAADPGSGHVAWEPSDVFAPSWERPHHASHDWMA